MDEKQIKPVDDWTKKEFESLPVREWNEDIGEFDSLVILPTTKIHDSGFRCMDFVAIMGNKPFCRLSGCSDVLHIDGIGGYGEYPGFIPEVIPVKSWSIDCLKKSGLLRIFCRKKLKSGDSLSSFELFAV